MDAKLNKTARWFIGHLYVERPECSGEREVSERLSRCSLITWARWSLEKGKEGNLHYQFLINVYEPVRRSKIFRALNMVKGEWLEPCNNVPAAKNYVKKDETHVDGPWEYSQPVSNKPSGSSVPSFPSGKSGRGDTSGLYPASERMGLKKPAPGVSKAVDKEFMKMLLNDKYNEILMWSEFIKSKNVTCLGTEKQL